MLGAVGSIGLMWPSTLQKLGVAGVMRAAGVRAFSATAKATAATITALSIAAGPLGRSIFEAAKSALTSAAQASSGLPPSGMAWAADPTIPTPVTTQVVIINRDMATGEVQ